MSYRTHRGQSVMDVLLQNKGALRGLVEIKDDIDSVTQVFDQEIEIGVDKEFRNTVVKGYDRKNISVVSDNVVAP